MRDRLVRGEVEPAGLLDLYGRVRRGKAVPHDDTNRLISLLRLSGIVRVVEGKRGACLAVRNLLQNRLGF